MRETAQTFGDGLNLVTKSVQVVLSGTGKTVVLAVAGGSCSGKSTFAKRLRDMLEQLGIVISVLGLDDYYNNVDHPDFPFDGKNRPIFDLPSSYLIDQFRHDVSCLLAGKDVLSPIYDKKTMRRLVGKSRLIKANRVIIAEGLFVVSALNDFNDDVVKIFIDADRHVRIDRRVARDTVKLHNGSVEDCISFILDRVEPYYLEYIAPQREVADISITSNQP